MRADSPPVSALIPRKILRIISVNSGIGLRTNFVRSASSLGSITAIRNFLLPCFRLDFFDDLIPSSSPFVSSISSPPIEEFPVSHIIPSIFSVQPDAYSPASHLPFLFHNAHQLEYMSYFIPFTNDRTRVGIVGFICLFSVPHSHRSSFFPTIWAQLTQL